MSATRSASRRKVQVDFAACRTGWLRACVGDESGSCCVPVFCEQCDGRGPAFDGAGTEKVSGLNGTAAWGAMIYGDGRRTGDRPDRFGRVVLADSTGEQHASRMKGVGRFP
jgi:hypothetical protein